MFKWRTHDRSNKITAVFKLQFHLTQVEEYGGGGLVVSVVPAENGKPTAKLEKCLIEENNCFWDNAVYETVKFILDPKSGKILDKIYYFFISTASGKGSVIGEFCINIAEYAGATKACSLSFPFKNSTSDTQFHVLIQRIQENGNLRDLQENEVVSLKQDDRTLRRHFSNGDIEEGVKASVEEEPLRKAASLQPTLHSTRRGSSGSDVTLSSTDSSSGLNTPREVGVQSKNTSTEQEQQRPQWELAIVPVNDSSSVYSLNSPRDVFLSETSQIGLDDSVERLKADLVALSRRAEVSELELQTLRKQIVKESKKGQDMLKEISMLKDEKNALKDECEKLKAYRKRSDDFKVKSKFQFEGDPWTFLEEIKEELNYEKEISANLRIQLQKTQDSNAELLFAVQDLEEMLEKSSKEVPNVSNRLTSGESAVEIEENMLKSQSDDDEEQKALEELVRQHSDAQETYLYEQKIMDLCSEIEMYRRDKDELEMQMEQLALDYEILKQENHEYCSRLEQNHLQDQLKTQCEGSGSYTAVKELETLREKLQNELAEKSEELSHCLGDVKDLEARNLRLEERLRKQAETFEADTDMGALTRSKTEHEKRASRAEEALIKCDAIISELEAKIEELENELEKNQEELTALVGTTKELESHNYTLEQELEKQAEGYEASMDALVHAKMGQEQRAMRAEDALSRCHVTIDELEANLKNLENELKLRSEESLVNLETVKGLEAHIQDLEEEMEKRAESFEADLEVVTRSKVEQEQRAIRAEEALRLVRWKNANTAARIQDEFKRLSTQMQSSFDANEKVASKAMTEASELRMHNRHLRDLLQKANDDIQSAKHDYETKLQELCSRIEEKSSLVETEKKRADEVQKDVSAQVSDIKTEIERLVSENKLLAENAKRVDSLNSELDQMKTLISEKDELLQREITEKGNLRQTIASAKEVGGKSMEEVIALKHLKDEKDQMVRNLQFEVDELKARCDNLTHSLYEDESEKERLRKQVFQLQSDLLKKDEAISTIEKKLKESNETVVQETLKVISKNAKSGREGGSKEAVTLKERVKFLEGQIKLKENAFETSATAFLAKEKILQGKIEELETRLAALDLSRNTHQDAEVKEEKVSVGTQVACDEAEETSSTAHFSNTEFDSNAQIPSETEPTQSDNDSGEQNKFDILLKEMVVLKERNNSMEEELKEMQERYSEISLKFAEVEGERQQLVMKLRNLKNKKG